MGVIAKNQTANLCKHFARVKVFKPLKKIRPNMNIHQICLKEDEQFTICIKRISHPWNWIRHLAAIQEGRSEGPDMNLPEFLTNFGPKKITVKLTEIIK